MKIIAMIPARMGSQRIKQKNIRPLNGKPLIGHIIDTAVLSGVFDEIYINSESEVFQEIANYYNINFYKRPEYLSSNEATNDEFVMDFIKNVEGDLIIQLLSTSPFLNVDEIRSFVEKMKEEKLDTLISVKAEQIECVFDGKPVNFDRIGQTLPSQSLTPIYAYACGIMGWKYSNFISNMKKFNSGYHGGKGEIGYFPLKGYSTIDIDNEEDFDLAEVVSKFLDRKNTDNEGIAAQNKQRVETFVPDILKNDGVVNNDFAHENIPINNIDSIINSHDSSISWSHRVVNTENNSATIISQLPGEGNRLHYHPNWNEWWYIIKGQWKWEIEGDEFFINKGDIVFIEKGKKHKITAAGNGPAIRIAVSRGDVPHIYDDEE
ncbi:MAG: cupin domain-containing protein [Bacteroidales bacterium]|jgi:CMP-N-acetylneuraminic acid synthetase/mannose-6-phosphate isomerase-like protein (cupin superfamily)|nr:cupin domain-containing protein [Bacteroidales bacterium]